MSILHGTIAFRCLKKRTRIAGSERAVERNARGAIVKNQRPAIEVCYETARAV
jgi:hypothetical protein